LSVEIVIFGELLPVESHFFWNFININLMSFLMHPDSTMISVETLPTTTTSLEEIFKYLDRSSPVITL